MKSSFKLPVRRSVGVHRSTRLVAVNHIEPADSFTKMIKSVRSKSSRKTSAGKRLNYADCEVVEKEIFSYRQGD
jgi:hypothetical protein